MIRCLNHLKKYNLTKVQKLFSVFSCLKFIILEQTEPNKERAFLFWLLETVLVDALNVLDY